jgi:uncharacterized protein (DUF2141 family)
MFQPSSTRLATLAAALLAACATPPASTPSPAATQVPAPSVARAATSACMQLQVAGLKVGQGFLFAAAYSSAESFFKQPVWSGRAEAKSDTATLSVCELSGGEIAFTVFQDLNGNGKLDTNPLGIPSEPYGVSGKPVFGAPSWSNAKVAAGAGLTVRIEL